MESEREPLPIPEQVQVIATWAVRPILYQEDPHLNYRSLPLTPICDSWACVQVKDRHRPKLRLYLMGCGS